MSERDASLSERLERFIAWFRGEFRRREQAEWAAVYLRGLLQSRGRKTIESLARSVALLHKPRADDVAQALQHFINQSPWDEQRLWRRYQQGLTKHLEPDGLFVLEEWAFHKQGRHSVGVQRQYSAALGDKTNCQIAISLHHASTAALVPLALRLYLPRHWLEDPARLDAAGVPETARRFAAKKTIALELLDRVRESGISARAVAPGHAWGDVEGLPQAIKERGLTWLPTVPTEWAGIVRRSREDLKNELGLNHFEGRSWRGFHHHACLVLLAQGFLVSPPNQTELAWDE